MALSQQQLYDVGRYWATFHFVAANQTAIYSLEDLKAAAQSLDTAFDTTLNNAVIAVGGNMTIINGLNANLPSPFSGATPRKP